MQKIRHGDQFQTSFGFLKSFLQGQHVSFNTLWLNTLTLTFNMLKAQNYVPKDIQNKNKFHFIQRPMGPDFFLQILEFEEMYEWKVKILGFLRNFWKRGHPNIFCMIFQKNYFSCYILSTDQICRFYFFFPCLWRHKLWN